MLTRRLGLWGIIVGVATLVATGCDGPRNQPPSLAPIEAQVVRVDVGTTVRLEAMDPDGDPIELSFAFAPEPASLAEASGGAPRIDPIADGGIFSWTPIAADAADGPRTYTVTFTATDAAGATGTAAVELTVEPRPEAPGELRFVEPVGEAVLSRGECVEAGIRVEGRGHADEAVLIEMEVPEAADCDMAGAKCEPLMLEPAGPGMEKTLVWCPTTEQLGDSAQHSVRLVARSLGGDVMASKRLALRFHREAAPGCPGAPPTIDHLPPESIEGPLDYVITARIDDDLGLKVAPMLAFDVQRGEGLEQGEREQDEAEVAALGWPAVPFARQDGDRWQTAIPNLNLLEGERAVLRYAIFAIDDDDAESTRCDHATASPVYTLEVRGGHEPEAGYGVCANCRSDEQCGGPNDLCLQLFDGAFCGRGCEAHDDCDAGELCAEYASVDGVTAFQCVPADGDCGQVCRPDMFEAAQADPEAALAIEPGAYDDLSLCDGDVDRFSIRVMAGDMLTVRADFDGARGDLDLALRLPGAARAEHQSVGGGSDEEIVREPCVPAAGGAEVELWSADGMVVPRYALQITLEPGRCDAPCPVDPYDEGPGNDTLERASEIELPFDSANLSVCSDDPDVYAFPVEAGAVIRVQLDHARIDGDLGLRLWRDGAVIGESIGFRDSEVVEADAALAGTYAVEVFGQTERTANTYRLQIETLAGQRCDHSRSCPAGQVCVDGMCGEYRCQDDLDCGEGLLCTRDQVGEDRGGGVCAPRCQSARDCRAEVGYACKSLGTKAVCLLEGPEPIGGRCGRHSDCATEAACLDLPGGYCARLGCEPGDCGPDAACVTTDGGPACMRACDDPGACRVAEGYQCVVEGEVEHPVCLPGPEAMDGDRPPRGR